MDARQLDELITAHYERLYRAAIVLTGNRWDAEDLIQETLLKALSSSFSQRSRPETWLYGILMNQHRMMQRSDRRLWRRCLGWLARQPSRPSPQPEDELLAQEWETSLWKRVAELPEPQRAVVVLRYAQQYRHDQIAEILECPVGTVKSRLHHALKTLQLQLADDRPECPLERPVNPSPLLSTLKPNITSICHE